jgi:hypothetical protein
MKAAPIALGLILLSVFPAVGQSAPLDLARRYVAASGGMTVAILATHMGILNSEHCKQSMTCHATSPGRFKAIQEAVEQDRTAIEAADEGLAETVSQILDTPELEAYLAFWESPNGRSIQRKRAVQGIVFYQQDRIPRGLTKAEQDALSAYLQTPAALGITGKENKLFKYAIPIDIKLQIQVAKDAGAIYCRHTGYCTAWVEERK